MKLKLTLLLLLFGILQSQGQSKTCEGFSAEVTDITCGPDGTAMVILTGGTPPYFGQGQQVALGYFYLRNLDDGPHTFTFYDSNECSVEVTFEIPSCDCGDLEANVSSISCGPDGVVVVQVSGGIGPYSGDGFQVAPGYFIIRDLTVDTHIFSFSDSRGCDIQIPVFVPECGCEHLQAEYNIRSCGPGGGVSVYLSGGTEPYTGDGWQPVPGVFLIDDLAPGPHTFSFTDADGCEIQVAVTIIDNEGLDASITDVSGCSPSATVQIEVSGGTPPYYGDGDPISNTNSFLISGLGSGPHTFIYTDAIGCTTEVSVNIKEEIEISSIETSTSDCSDTGTATITLSGGAPPYFDPNGNTTFTDNFSYQNLAIGEYVWTFYDSAGCEVEVVFNIEHVYIEGCDPFDFDRDQWYIDSNTGLYQESFISLGYSTVNVAFLAVCVPDSLVISLNNDEIINVAAGSGGCVTPLDPTIFTSFCVEPCDTVKFTVYSNICDDLHSCSNPNTAWDLIVTCNEGCTGDISTPNAEVISRHLADNPESAGLSKEAYLHALSDLQLYPNPVSDILSLKYSHDTFNYSDARIYNSVGQLVLEEKISKQGALQLGTSNLPKGIYLLEMKEASGTRVVKKFMKVD